jgi:hypothetical protein
MLNAIPDNSLHSHYSSTLKAMSIMSFGAGVLANLTSNHGRIYYHPRCPRSSHQVSHRLQVKQGGSRSDFQRVVGGES